MKTLIPKVLLMVVVLCGSSFNLGWHIGRKHGHGSLESAARGVLSAGCSNLVLTVERGANVGRIRFSSVGGKLDLAAPVTVEMTSTDTSPDGRLTQLVASGVTNVQVILFGQRGSEIGVSSLTTDPVFLSLEDIPGFSSGTASVSPGMRKKLDWRNLPYVTQ